MKKNFKRKLLIIAPVAILIFTLLFIEYTLSYFKDNTYKFVYNTHVDSTQMFSREMERLTSAGGNTSEEDSLLYFKVINAYNKTLGGKYAMVSFLLDKNSKIYHSNYENEVYVSELMENSKNESTILQIALTNGAGSLELKNNGKSQTWFYQEITDGNHSCYLFMSVDKELMQVELHANEIIIPISIIGFLLLICIEYIIWLKRK